jgi:hypothetical protein
MTDTGRILKSWLAVLIVFAMVVPAIAAEPAENESDDGVLVAGITEGPDPIPQVIWADADSLYPSMDIPSGRSDGRPDVTEDRDGNPVVTWAYRNGADHDVALLVWGGRSWNPIEFVTSGSANEIDPRTFVDSAGQFDVVWWVPGAVDTVFHVRGTPASFGHPRAVAVGGRRPSVASFGGTTLLAYERDAKAGTQEIVLVSEGTGGAYVSRPLFVVEHAGPLDVALHHGDGRLWMDWRASGTSMAYSTSTNGSWSTPTAVPLADPTWSGTQQTRTLIRQLVLSP